MSVPIPHLLSFTFPYFHSFSVVYLAIHFACSGSSRYRFMHTSEHVGVAFPGSRSHLATCNSSVFGTPAPTIDSSFLFGSSSLLRFYLKVQSFVDVLPSGITIFILEVDWPPDPTPSESLQTC